MTVPTVFAEENQTVSRFVYTILMLGMLLFLGACTASQLSSPPETIDLYTVDPLQFRVERMDDDYELMATCTSSGDFTEIMLDVATTNTTNNTAYQANQPTDGNICSAAGDELFTTRLFTKDQLVPGETFDICVDVSFADGASNRCQLVMVCEDGYITLQAP